MRDFHGEHALERVHPAQDLATLGPGTTSVMVETDEGMRGQREVRLFLMPCGCHVQHPGELGGPCTYCLSALLTAHERQPRGLSPEELQYCATPCAKHYHHCAAPFCEVGGCAAHVARAEDGCHYCPSHFQAWARESAIAEVEALGGYWLARLYAYVTSLFHA